MNIKATLLTSILAITVASSAYAMRPGDGPLGELPRPPSVDYLQERLELSDEQAESLKALFKEQRAKRKAFREAHREMRDQTRERISEILTENQMEELEDMKLKKGPRWH